MPSWLIFFNPFDGFLELGLFGALPGAFLLYGYLGIRLAKAPVKPVTAVLFMAAPPATIATAVVLDENLATPFFLFMALLALSAPLEARRRVETPRYRREFSLIPMAATIIWYFAWLAMEITIVI